MRTARIWRRAVGVEHTVIESIDLEDAGRGAEVLIASVPPQGWDRVAVLTLRTALPGLRRQQGAVALAGPGSPDDTRVPAGHHPQGVLCRARGRGGRRTVSAAGVAVHHRVRGHHRMAGPSRHRFGRGGAAAGRVAPGVGHRDPGGHRASRADRPTRGAVPDRDRRDQPPQRSALPDGRDLPRHRPVGVGGEGSHQGHAGPVLR